MSDEFDSQGSHLHADGLKEHGYEYNKPLRKGGMSSVFLARSVQYDEYFAVKVTDVSHCNYQQAMQELKMLKCLLLSSSFTDVMVVFFNGNHCFSESFEFLCLF